MAKQQKNNKINIVITTPRGVKITEKAEMVIMRCVDGDLGVMPGHAPVSAVLGDGILRIFNKGIEKKIALFGGIADIDHRTVKILSTIAQRPEDIELDRAEKDRKEAEATILEESDETKIKSLQTLLYRSLVRIEVSNHLVSTDYYDEESKK